ncbi:MAG: anti-sigma factor family protein [Chitinophagaceae bacterium]
MLSDKNQHLPPGEQQMEDRLWEYLDGYASPAERSVIEKLLSENEAWKKKHQALVEVREMLRSSELDQPSLRFTRNVMEEISRLYVAPAAKSYINKKIVWGIGFFFIALLVGIFVYAIGQMSFSGGEESSISRNLSKVDYSRIFSNTWVNALMMVNVVIGLFLLDNYFTIKKKKFRKAGM